ncbi:MAG: PhnD/SsuA/transferrin family substrate-binding protein [Pseudomonadota bacterium]|nr:PhnD/SsuA/transferrin family substrate-binding protein [Pseudomonadota bacterium]
MSPAGNPNRRQFLSGLAAVALGALACPVHARDDRQTIRIGFTPAFVHDQHALLADWRRYMEKRLGLKVEIVQRDSYRETMDLLRLKQMDFAWVCDYPFLHLKDLVRLLAVPLYKGQPLYRSYIIVPAGNTKVTGLKDLKNTVFAYADPLSNSGYLYPRFAIHELGENPQTFFRKTFFTWSHKKVVEAVAMGIAQGGAVDSYIWETLERISPELTRRTRIVQRSPEYGFPPFVAHRDISPELFARVQHFLLTMHQDAEGAALLKPGQICSHEACRAGAEFLVSRR